MLTLPSGAPSPPLPQRSRPPPLRSRTSRASDAAAAPPQVLLVVSASQPSSSGAGSTDDGGGTAWPSCSQRLQRPNRPKRRWAISTSSNVNPMRRRA
eukprot:3436048-Prymnesium_polylepis.1